LDGGGEMGALIRAFDWAKTPIGAPSAWSPALRTTVRILLANRFPMLLWWGPQYISIYNDAYSPILGLKHPWGLGRPVRECWSEIWHILQPLIDTPFNGGPATWIEDIELQLNRFGSIEETHFTVAYSPVPDVDAGRVGGVLATVHEITEKVIGARRGAILRELGARAAEVRTAEDACVKAIGILAEHAKDIPFASIYLIDKNTAQARLVASTGMETAREMVPAAVALCDAAAPWPFALAWQDEQMQIVTDLGSHFTAVPRGFWPEPPHTAAVVPVRSNTIQGPAGLLVVGLSSHLKFDEAYKDFLDLAASQIASAVASARAYEEERKRAEALAEIDRAKTTFFSNVSHEFRTPLTLMLGPLENVLAMDGMTSEVRDQLVTVHRNSLRLLKLVNSLLDFSRIEAGRIKATYSPVDLAVFTQDLASNFRSVFESAGLVFDVKCPPLPYPVYVDRDMWEKIVLNLLSNAFKFTFEGGVTVTLEARDSHAVLTVADTGVGIPETELAHIFERFHRVEFTKSRTYEGTGIGLALIQELVKLHGGTIDVASRLAQGSAFTVSLPFGSGHLPREHVTETPASTQTTAVRAEPYIGEAKSWLVSDDRTLESPVRTEGVTRNRNRVLVADDNADMREHVARILGNTYEIVTAANGLEALAAARDTHPDIILSDVMMPGLDGFALLKELRADAELRDIPIILLSARAGEEARTEGISAGADDYVTKPFNMRELQARIETTLNLRNVRLQAREEIARSEERFRGFVTATSDIIYRMSPDWSEMRYLDGRDFVADTSDPTRRWLEKYIHPDDRERVLIAINQAIETKTPFELEHRVIRVDGSVGWTFSRAVPLVDSAGNIIEWFGTARNVSVRKAAEQALQEAYEALTRSNADLQQFGYSASHDLQEPLRMVAIYSELLMKNCGDQLGPDGQEYLGHVMQGARRMDQLLTDLRTYMVASTDGDTPVELLDADKLLDNTLTTLEVPIKDSGAVVTRDPLPSIRMRELQLSQLFQNLISNALRYRADRPPRIHVSARLTDSGWLFSVADNGIGIDPVYRQKIFEIFKRLHSSAEYPGSGMGLAICRRIIERAGGRIWVESEPGQGSTFFFTVPNN
jgi:signal transduction histidine kinase